jgi:hypothetical protein
MLNVKIFCEIPIKCKRAKILCKIGQNTDYFDFSIFEANYENTWYSVKNVINVKILFQNCLT